MPTADDSPLSVQSTDAPAAGDARGTPGPARHTDAEPGLIDDVDFPLRFTTAPLDYRREDHRTVAISTTMLVLIAAITAMTSWPSTFAERDPLGAHACHLLAGYRAPTDDHQVADIVNVAAKASTPAIRTAGAAGAAAVAETVADPLPPDVRDHGPAVDLSEVAQACGHQGVHVPLPTQVTAARR